MRMSCNGCRVLRKGCSDNCSIRPCLEWIKNPDSQANATVFLAKFYGRAGLMNLINAGPPQLRPAIFRSLLYEACGRIVNPIHGSVGLMWSGSWHLCHTAVEAVLRGAPITPMVADPDDARSAPPFKAYDIRHVNKESKLSGSNDLHRVKNRYRFKRSGEKSMRARVSVCSGDESSREEVNRSPSHESSLSHQSEAAAVPNADRESLASAGNVKPEPALDSYGDELELTLGFEPLSQCSKTTYSEHKGSASEFCMMELRLDCPAS